jgi:hypothetical protein
MFFIKTINIDSYSLMIHGVLGTDLHYQVPDEGRTASETYAPFSWVFVLKVLVSQHTVQIYKIMCLGYYLDLIFTYILEHGTQNI